MLTSICKKSKNIKLKIVLFIVLLFSFLSLYQSNAFAYDHLKPGEWVVSAEFEDAKALFDGMVLFTDLSGTKCIINSNRSDDGAFFMELIYDRIDIPDTKTAFSLASNMFIAKKKNDMHIAYYDKYGVEVLNNEYLDGYLFSGGIAWVKKDVNGKELWGAINSSGNTTVDFIYNSCTPLSGGNALVNLQKANVWVIVDGYGSILSEIELLAGERELIKDNNGIQVFSVKDTVDNVLLGAYSSTTKKDIVPIGKYDEIDNTNASVIIVKKDGLYGLIDIWGNEFVPCIYEKIDVKEGFAILETKADGTGKKGIATLKEILFEAIYDAVDVASASLGTLSNTYYVVTTQDQATSVNNVYFFDKNFDYVRNNPFPTFVRDPATGYQVQAKFDSLIGKTLYGMIDRFGTEIIPYVYEELSFFENGYALIKKNNKYGLVKIDGNVALDCIAQQIIPWKDSGWINYCHCIARNPDTGLWGLLEVDSVATITLLLNKSQKLVNSFYKADTIIWQSMDTSIATVDTNGRVLAVGPGATSVIVFNLTTGVNKVYMINSVVPAKKVTAVPNKIILKIDPNGGQTLSGTARITYNMTSVSAIYPVDTSKVAITSKKPAVAEITYDGKIQALSIGKTTVTVQEIYGGKKANISVLVYELPSGVTITGKDKVALGKTITLKAEMANKKNVYKDDSVVLWESSDEKILRVDSKGRVTGISAGTAYVRATTLNGITVERQIDVAGGGSVTKFTSSGIKNIYTSNYSLKDSNAIALIKAMEIRSDSKKINTMLVEIEGYQRVPVTLDPFITEIDPNFEDFIQNSMYAPDGALTDENAERFVNTIVEALNAALYQVNPVFAKVECKILSDGRMAIYMANGKTIQIPSCSKNADDNTIGHGFLHMFFASLTGQGSTASYDDVFKEY